MFLLQLSVFPCYSVHSSFYINMLFYIIFTIFKCKFCNNQERYVKPKLDAKIATSILKSLYHETLFLLQIVHSFPFYHHWTSLKGQAENDAVSTLFSQEWLCSLRNSAWGSRLVLSQHQVSLLSPMFLCFPFSVGGWGTQEALFSHTAFPHLCLLSPWILFKNNGSKEGQPVKVLTTKPEDLSSGLSTHIMEGENWLLSTCTQTYAKLIDAMFLIVSKGQKPEIEKKKGTVTPEPACFSALSMHKTHTIIESPHLIIYCFKTLALPALFTQNKISHLQLNIRDWWNWK